MRRIFNYDEYIGKEINYLTILEMDEPYVSPSGKKYPRFKCKCKCNPDKEISIDARSVVVGNTTSCGCRKKNKQI